MTTYQKLAAVLIGFLLSSSTAFANWEAQAQRDDGSWEAVKKAPQGSTENAALMNANVKCKSEILKIGQVATGKNIPNPVLRIVDTDSGKERMLQCDLKAGGRLTEGGKPVQIARPSEPDTNKPVPRKAAGWTVAMKEKNGKWRSALNGLRSEQQARSRADMMCNTWKQPLKIIDGASGKEYELYCDPKTGKLSNDDQPIPVVMLTEPEANKHAQNIRRQCESNFFMKSALGCGCVESQARAEALRSDTNVTQADIYKKITNPPISNQCVNREDLYKYVYEPCASVLKSTRPDQAEGICTCAAKKTVADFAQNPALNLYHLNRLKDTAVRQCMAARPAGIGSVSSENH